MKYDFSTSTNRANTNSEKYALANEKFGTSDIIPAWIADMDIDSPIFVQKAIQKRLKHSVFGYELIPSSAYKEQINWLSRHHGTSYCIDDVFYSHSVVASMNVAIKAFTNKHDNVIVQTPVYAPFFKSLEAQNRDILYNPLILDKNGLYKMDLEGLKKQITSKTKMIIFCNPQNPSGRVWSVKELEKLVNICKENNILIFSDEVHCDLVYEPLKHNAISTINGAKDITISAYGIGKTFNLSGLAMSTVYIQNKSLKKIYKKVYDKFHFASGNCLSHVAFEVAYKYGDDWNKQLKQHLYKNYLMLKEVCDKHQKLITLMPVQATFLAWINFENLNMSDKKTMNFLINKAKLGLNRGIFFGKNGHSHFRLNFAVSTKVMKKITKQLDIALSNI